jgi:predicted membrane-bound mannosyltransferase
MLYAVVGGNRINDTMRTFTTTGVKVSNQEQSGTDNYSPSVSDTSSANDTPLANDTPTANDTPAASDTPAAADNGESTPVIKEVPNKIYIVSAVNQKTAKAVIKWKKDTAASWYQVQYSLNKSFKSVKSKKVTAIKCTVSGLKKGKTYYFRVRGYASGAGYGKWSNSKTIKIRR